MKAFRGTPVVFAGRGRWGCIQLLLEIAVLQLFHNGNMGGVRPFTGTRE